MKNNLVMWVGGVVVFIILVAVFDRQATSGPGELDAFATCLKDRGAIFYGTFWCPHCANQKKLFGKSVKFLPYVECSTADGKNQLLICKEKNITSYPTWDFLPVGEATTTTRLTGEINLDKLAEQTGCQLPTQLGAPSSK